MAGRALREKWAAEKWSAVCACGHGLQEHRLPEVNVPDWLAGREVTAELVQELDDWRYAQPRACRECGCIDIRQLTAEEYRARQRAARARGRRS